MYPVISIGNIIIPLFNAFIIFGIILSILLFLILEEKKLGKQEVVNIMVVLGITSPVGFICAYGFNRIVFSTEETFNMKNMLEYRGMTFLGGFCGGVLFFILVHRVMFHSWYLLKKHMNTLTPYFIIAHACGRIGCFCAGCCYGKPTQLEIGVSFPSGSPAYLQYGNTELFPTQLMEFIYLIFTLILICNIVISYRFVSYLFLYSIGRFILEFFRGDNRGQFWMSFSPSQFICVIILLGIIISSFIKKKYQQYKKSEVEKDVLRKLR